MTMTKIAAQANSGIRILPIESLNDRANEPRSKWEFDHEETHSLNCSAIVFHNSSCSVRHERTGRGATSQ
jgi:hypothetical protein